MNQELKLEPTQNRMSKDEFLKAKRSVQVNYTRLMLDTSDAWLLKGLVRIYERQTSDEQASEQTKYLNGVGFNGIDSVFLSSSAQRVQAKLPMSARHIAAIRRSMKKYAGQLVKIANGEA